jgi:hypothetical protein
MDDRGWMYTGRVGRNDVTPEWIRKTDDFVEQVYSEAAKGASLVSCPCSKCARLADTRQRGKPFAECHLMHSAKEFSLPSVI